MKKTNSIKFYLQLFFTLVTLCLFAGCADDEAPGNQKPILEISPESDGLTTTLKGKISDPDGSVANVFVDWGDTKSGYLVYIDFAAISVTHTYPNPAIYNIRMVAYDNLGDSTIQSFTVNIDFRETSLAGIQQSMYKVLPNEYLVLTVNLHTYQEANQKEKFVLIADVIGKMGVDFVAFQECAQNKTTPVTTGIIRGDNMALLISDRVKEKYSTDYNFVWNWAHYGWTVWEEGIAILSKYPLVNTDERYISTYTGTADISSRKVIFGSYQTPNGLFNLFSAHTYWRLTETDEEQNNQIKKIKSMATEKGSTIYSTPTMICGDFNGNPTSDYPWSEGYNTMMKNNEYTDTFLDIYPNANNKPAQSNYNTVGGDFPGRIDYIFMKNNSHLRVIDSQILFTKDVVGLVSDHFGVLTKVAFVE